MTCRLTLADIDTATESPDGGSPETIEFFLGLRRAGLPVRLIDSDSLVARLQETDMIGIVSEWEHPWYRVTIEGVYVQDVVQLIAIFKNKANSRRNGTSLSSQKAKLSEKHIVSRSEEHPGSVFLTSSDLQPVAPTQIATLNAIAAICFFFNRIKIFQASIP